VHQFKGNILNEPLKHLLHKSMQHILGRVDFEFSTKKAVIVVAVPHLEVRQIYYVKKIVVVHRSLSLTLLPDCLKAFRHEWPKNSATYQKINYSGKNNSL
jgi:beta-xylosidase